MSRIGDRSGKLDTGRSHRLVLFCDLPPARYARYASPRQSGRTTEAR